MRKSALSILLAVLMAVSMLTIGALAYGEDGFDLVAEINKANADTTGEPITINIPEGNYAPTANEQLRITRDNVTIVGAGMGKTIIDCGDYSCSGQGALLISADNVTIKDLTIKSSATSGNVGAIKVTDVNTGTNLIENVKIVNVDAQCENGHGINLHGVKDAVVTNCVVTGGKCGISLANAVNVTVSGTSSTGKWGSVGMMYKAGSEFYANPVSLTVGAGNSFTYIYSERGSIAADDQDSIKFEADVDGLKAVAGDGLKVEAAEGVSVPVASPFSVNEVYYASIENAIAAAAENDTIEIAAGEHEIGNVNVNKAVNIKGAGSEYTVLVGSFDFRDFSSSTTNKEITVEGITVKSPEDNTAVEQGIEWGYSTSDTLQGFTLNVVNCKVEDYLFAIGVNSSAKNCVLNVRNLELQDVWCGANVSEGAGNSVGDYEIAAGSKVTYEIQVFDSKAGYNCYYETTEKWLADKDSHTNADKNGNSNKPSPGDWPAAAMIDDVYYGSIQEAVNYADENDTIIVLPGTYDEVVTFNGKSLTIQAQNPAYENGHKLTDDYELSKFTGTFYTGADSNPGSFNEDQSIVIDGFALSGDGLKIGTTNWSTIGNLTVRHCTMEFGKNIDTSDYYNKLNKFIYVNGGTNGVFANFTVEDNYISGTPLDGENPLLLWGVQTAVVKNNVFEFTSAKNLQAINISKLDENAVVEVAGNKISNVTGGIYVTTWYCGGDTSGETPFVGKVNIAYNTFTNVETPIFVGYEVSGHAAFEGDLEEKDNISDGQAVAAVVGVKPGAVEYYTVTVMDGRQIVLIDNVKYGDTFVLPEAPSSSGHVFMGWNSGEKNYAAGDSVKVTGNMTFTAVWANHPDTPYEPDEDEDTPEVPEFPFYDVARGAWYYNAVAYVYNKGLMDGVDTHEFAPEATLTRAMVWTILARMEGVDTTGGATWYAKAQEWATAKGISDGENPNAAITREQFVTMLYRLAGEPAVSGSVTAPDAANVSSWAADAMTWAVNVGLVEGDENGNVNPTANANRAEAAALIMRFIEK